MIELTSSNASKISILGWCMVQTTVLPVSTVLRTVRITIAAARASSPDVGSSIKIIEGFATSSTAIVNLFLCSVDKPELPGIPTKACLKESSSTSFITCSINSCKIFHLVKIYKIQYSIQSDIQCVMKTNYTSFLKADFLGKTKRCRKPQRLLNCNLRRMYIILFNISGYSGKCPLLFWVTWYFDVPFDIPSSFPASKYIHQCGLSSSTRPH